MRLHDLFLQPVWTPVKGLLLWHELTANHEQLHSHRYCTAACRQTSLQGLQCATMPRCCGLLQVPNPSALVTAMTRSCRVCSACTAAAHAAHCWVSLHHHTEEGHACPDGLIQRCTGQPCKTDSMHDPDMHSGSGGAAISMAFAAYQAHSLCYYA